MDSKNASPPSSSVPCPSCGKPNPPAAPVCHYCTARMRERLPVKVVFLGALSLLAVAAAHFYLAVTYRPVYANIKTLTVDRTFDHVRVLGMIKTISVQDGKYDHKVVRLELAPPELGEKAGYQETIPLKLDGEVAQDYLKMKEPFQEGDVVDVAASLYAGLGFRQLSVNGLTFLRLVQAAPRGASPKAAAATVAELLASPERYQDKKVTVAEAVLAEVSESLPLLKILDPGAQGEPLVVFGFKGAGLKTGDRVTVRGRFVFYDPQGYWEIKTERGDGQAVVSAGPVPPGGKE